VIVVDASVLAVALGDDQEDGRRNRRAIDSQELFAPELVDLEVASYVRRAARSGQVTPERALQALRDLGDLPLERESHTPLLSRIWELRDNLMAYDAAYVALAEALGAPLLTSDARLSRASGLACEVVLVS
jgi:predicted nucleic acid-binding protein